MSKLEKVRVSDKYELVTVDNCANGFYANRHGEEWKDLTGDNLTLACFYKIQELEKERENLISAMGIETGECEHLIKENEELRSIITKTLWMARRYADGRSTYAPHDVNMAIDLALSLGIELDGPIDKPYAEDGMFGEWNPETQRFKEEADDSKE